MITPFPGPEEDSEASHDHPVAAVASWASAVVSQMSEEEPLGLPGIVSPLEFRADFAVNSQVDAASVTLGNGVVRLPPRSSVPTSGTLTLSLRWTDGYRADGVREGDRLVDDWVVDLVESTGIDLRHEALAEGRRDATVPVVTIVKPSQAAAGDEFTARLSGEAPQCRDARIHGWAHS